MEPQARRELHIDEWRLKIEGTVMRGRNVGDDWLEIAVRSHDRVVQAHAPVRSIDPDRRGTENDDVFGQRRTSW